MSCFTDLITICYYYYYYNLWLIIIIIYHLLIIIIIIIVIVVWDLYTAVFYYRSLFQTAPGWTPRSQWSWEVEPHGRHQLRLGCAHATPAQ